ncbi:hypothetical protein VN97_g3613 [Penicillium thymicola]|uniref:Uncharacterized protein n=1 Tax=Penicillium thymicola TaxID=293382 RepID=A0AAI9XB38_PENTH|nr:hypothetical protein VN97_g3613 [Penicillium thymicola]
MGVVGVIRVTSLFLDSWIWLGGTIAKWSSYVETQCRCVNHQHGILCAMGSLRSIPYLEPESGPRGP